MNVHTTDFGRTGFGDIRQPELDLAELRAAAIRNGGAEELARRNRERFELLNPGVHQAQAVITQGDRQIAFLEQTQRRLERQFVATAPFSTLSSNEPAARPALLHQLTGIFLLLLGLFALWMGNRVGAAYVVRSGADLYATDTDGAALFMGVVLLASAALKAFELGLPNDRARSLLQGSVFAIGLLAVVIWVMAMAYSFAPEASGQNWLTSANASSRVSTIALLISHILSDIALGFVVFHGGEKLLLGGKRRIVVSNPHFDEMERRIDALHAEILSEALKVGEAEDYLRRFGAGVRDAESRVHAGCQREAARHQHAREAAIAAAQTNFLNS